jgi:hypothetical protein
MISAIEGDFDEHGFPVTEIRLREWDLEFVDLFYNLVVRSGSESALRVLLHSRNLRADELISIAKLNSLAIENSWLPPVNLAHTFPRLETKIRPLLGEIFRPDGFPKRFRGDETDLREAFIFLVDSQLDKLRKAKHEEDQKTISEITNIFKRTGITTDPEFTVWWYDLPEINPRDPIYDEEIAS